MIVTFTVGPVRLNLAGFRRLRTSPGAQAIVLGRARKWAAACGPGFEASLSPGRNRARAIVRPVTAAAQKRDLAELTMLRTMGSARG